MRAAPAFEIDLPRGRRERVAGALLYALAGAALGYWWLGADANAPPREAAAVVAAALAALAGAWVCRLPTGRLRWDGQQWSLQGAGVTAEQPLPGLRPTIDLGPWLLLRAGAVGRRARWIVVSRHSGAAVWPALRLALFASAAEADPAARGGAP